MVSHETTEAGNKNLKECLFCEIAEGKRAASIVHSDDHCIAFMDLYPLRPGHVLVMPKQHAVFLHELNPEQQRHLFSVGCRVLNAQQAAGLPWHGANLMVNDGPASGQHIPHVHLHVIPRVQGDKLSVVAGMLGRAVNIFGRAVQREQLDRMAASLRAHF